MQLHQYARLSPDRANQQAELSSIGFPVHADSLAALIRASFAACEPQAHTTNARDDALATRAVDDHTSLLQFVQAKPGAMTREQFYTVALQYLGFEAGTDFQFGSACAYMTKTTLPMVVADINSQDEFCAAFYLLLNTRSKNLVTFIDALAERGYFQNQLGAFKIFNGKVLPTFDTRKIIRECVWIESDLDTDGDGKRDMLEASIFRPAETETSLKVPALFTANPYFHGTNDVTAVTHEPEPDLAVKPAQTQPAATATAPVDLPQREVQATATEASVYADEQGIYSLNDYFLARGFATVYSAGVGTKNSDGLRSTGGPDETASAVAIIEWLGGKRRAFTTRSGHTAIEAWWCNGSVAMTGKSYLGTLAIAAATSGTPALKTIISESAISSWYDYYREGGLVVAPGGFQGEDADVLAVDTYSRLKNAGENAQAGAAWQQRLKDLERLQDRKYGDYTAFWDARNYRKLLAGVKCDIVSVHGLNDWNVKPRNVIKLHEALAHYPVQHKLFLHQGQHVYLNNVRSLDFTDQMNLWLTNKLLGIDNDAAGQLPDVTIQDNVQAETWVTQADFGTGAGIEKSSRPLGSGTASFTDQAKAAFTKAGDNSNGFEYKIIQPNSIYADSRLVLDFGALPADLVMEGTAHLQLKLSIDQPSAIVSARLVDLGAAKRFKPNATIVGPKAYPQGCNWQYDNILEFQPTEKVSAAKLMTFAHRNTQNPVSDAVSVAPAHGEELTLEMDFQPTRYHLPAGRHLALILHGADMAQTIRPNVQTHFTINLAGSTLTLPIRKQ
ncbi:MAG: Xaa-Pro dipeptidyl-peptidase [Lacticaseibacillus songhuajiangensis]|jgi:X-Pro dipeptidyl-peptidase|nr:Xaa-Pro dipeptidyl-peptidase [Lacticaseibacillus songhuajiangensis]